MTFGNAPKQPEQIYEPFIAPEPSAPFSESNAPLPAMPMSGDPFCGTPHCENNFAVPPSGYVLMPANTAERLDRLERVQENMADDDVNDNCFLFCFSLVCCFEIFNN